MNKFSFHGKPKNWQKLELYKKIRFTMNKFNNNFADYVDKLKAKQIVKNICKETIKIPNTIRVLNNIDDLKLSDLHSNYLIKATHGSGYNINIEKNINYNIQEIKNLLQKFNKKYNSCIEIQYSYLDPCFFIEEKIDDKFYGKDGNCICYMIRCLHGVPYTFSPYVKSRNLQKNFLYNSDKSLKEINMNYESFNQKYFNIDIKAIGENNIKKMYDIAEKLSNDFEFVRIDLYLDKDNYIYFSEYTFTPGCGSQNYPEDIELLLGSYWK